MADKSTTYDNQSSSPTTSGPGRATADTAGAEDRPEKGPQKAMQSVARELKGEASHMAGDFAGQAKKAAESKLGAGKDFAAEHLGSVADALRKTSKELRENESAVTEYVDKAANTVEKVSQYFQTRTLGQLVGDVEQYARREPAVFLGGAFFAGMLGGRFLKAATPARTSRTPPTENRAIAVSTERQAPQQKEGSRDRDALGSKPNAAAALNAGAGSSPQAGKKAADTGGAGKSNDANRAQKGPGGAE